MASQVSYSDLSNYPTNFPSGKLTTENNMRLTVGDRNYTISDGRFRVEESKEEKTRLKLGYFYQEGPEFRDDYRHERVEY